MNWRIYNSKFQLTLLIAIVLFVSGCGKYSLSGKTTDAESVTVRTFLNSGGGPPNMARDLTEGLKTYYLQNGRLKILTEEGQLQVEGEITNYQTSPLAPTSNDQTAQTRLTVSVSVRFTNLLHPEEDFEQTFTQYADFDQSLSLSQVESEKVQEILDKIIYDVFQKTAANW